MSDSGELPFFENLSGDIELASERSRPHYFQLDVLKAIAIALVVMDHSLTWEVKGSIGGVFWERLSIPFFLMVMGFNMAVSFKYRGGSSIREFCTLEYLKRKTIRYVLPYMVLYMGSIFLGLYFGYLSFNEYSLLGFLPFWGPGDWFIPLLFGSIIIFPFVYWMFRKHPILAILLCFISEIILQLVMYIFFPLPIDTALEGFMVSAIRVSVLFFLPAIALGVWFSEGYSLFERHNWFLAIYTPVCFIFMIDYTTHIFRSIEGSIGYFFTTIDDIFRGDYTLLFYGWAAVLMLIALSLIPQSANGSIQTFIQKIGRASYHILLFQILWMSVVYWSVSHEAVYNRGIPQFASILGWSTQLFYIPFYLMNLMISLAGGLLWYEAEKRATAGGKPWWKHAWFRRAYYIAAAVMSLVMMGVAIEFISDFFGLTQWSETHDQYFILNEITGPAVMACFLIILCFIGFSMVLIYRAFTSDNNHDILI